MPPMKHRFLVDTLVRSGHSPDGCGMTTDPGYYSGRGARLSDLNSSQLEKIHTSILRNAGKEAAAAFAQMVLDIPKLTATDFLVALRALDAADFLWDKGMLGAGNGLHIDSHEQAFAVVASVLTGESKFDETAEIRGPFLRARGLYDPEKHDPWLSKQHKVMYDPRHACQYRTRKHPTGC